GGHGHGQLRGVPSGPATRMDVTPSSAAAARSSSDGPSPPVTSAAASRERAPLEMAVATATCTAESRSAFSETSVAAYVRPVSSRTAAPAAEPLRAREARANVMSLLSSGSRVTKTRLGAGHPHHGVEELAGALRLHLGHAGVHQRDQHVAGAGQHHV